jgi:hypothetical protein
MNVGRNDFLVLVGISPDLSFASHLADERHQVSLGSDPLDGLAIAGTDRADVM